MTAEFDAREFGAALVAQAADAIVYADAQGVIRFWNAGASRIFGFSEAEAVG
jgi:PAS domain S-box-containing protein